MHPIITADDSCPCGRGDAYGECCGRFIGGQQAPPTAEQLMRSRFTAFVLADESYLLRTWDKSTRPLGIDFDSELHWTRLHVLSSSRGGPFDDVGHVHFVALYRTRDGRGRLEEISSFARRNGTWFYVDGEFPAS